MLNIVSSTGNDIDTTIVVDTDKLFQMEGTDIAQPFWYLSDSYLCFTDTFVNKSTKLYGVSTGGYLCEIFTPGQRWDEVPVRITPNKNYIFGNTFLPNYFVPSHITYAGASDIPITSLVKWNIGFNDTVIYVTLDQGTFPFPGYTNYLGALATLSFTNPVYNSYKITDITDYFHQGRNNYNLAHLSENTNQDMGQTGYLNLAQAPLLITASAHGLKNGSSVQITGTTNYNGTFIVSNVTTDTFTIDTPFVADEASSMKIYPSNLMVAIPWAGYTAWQKVSDFEATLYDAYASIEVGGMWSLNFTTNSFVLGESIPPFDQGASKQVYPYNLGGQFYNLNNYMDGYANGNGQMSLNGFEEARGNYFSFGFYGSNVNEWAKIFSIEPRYVGIKSTPMGANN